MAEEPQRGDSLTRAWGEHRAEEKPEKQEEPAAEPQFVNTPEGDVLEMPTITDSSGIPIESRPDTIIKKYLDRTQISMDEYSQAMNRLNMRKWSDLRVLIEQIMPRYRGDDAIRLQNCLDTIENIRRNNIV